MILRRATLLAAVLFAFALPAAAETAAPTEDKPAAAETAAPTEDKPAAAETAAPTEDKPAAAADIAAHTQEYPDSIPDMVLGSKDAPISIVEYSSLTCSHCAAFHTTTLPRLKAEWIATGKAKLVYRDFPLDPVAMGGALVARCLPPERYFPFLDTLFAMQRQWAGAQQPVEALRQLARFAGVPDAEFEKCRRDADVLQGIQKKQLEGQEKYKIDSTPQFVIGDEVVRGNLPYAEFEKALKAAQ